MREQEGRSACARMPLKVSIPGTAVTSKHLLKAHRDLSGHNEKIVTGRRINSASDDAANSGVASNLNAQQRSTRVAMRNIADGVSLVTTMESTANQISDKVMRMRELAVQGSGNVLGAQERRFLQAEMASVQEEVDRLAQASNFNGLSYANGVNSSIELQLGSNNSSSDRMTIDFSDMTTSNLFGGKTVGVKTTSNSQDSLKVLDRALDRLGSIRSGFGSDLNVMSAAESQAELYAENITVAESRVLDTDYARETAEMARAQMVIQANVAVRSHAGVSAQAIASLI